MIDPDGQCRSDFRIWFGNCGGVSRFGVKMSMKNKVVSCIVIIIVTVCLSLCTRMGIDVERDLKVLRSDSWFDDFYIKEDKVFMKCEITIQNKSNQDRYIKLFANMEEDANNGLIKSPTVSGYDKEGNDKFFVSANKTKKYFHATYFHPQHSDCYIKPQPLFYIILISPAIHLSRVSRYRCNVSESP